MVDIKKYNDISLIDLRKRLGWSQSQFAEYFDIPVASVHNWEQGRRKPPKYLISLIIRVLIREGLLPDEL